MNTKENIQNMEVELRSKIASMQADLSASWGTNNFLSGANRVVGAAAMIGLLAALIVRVTK